MSAPEPSTGASLSPLAETDVVILAGGLGTRLAPVFPDRPKVLAPLAGRPIIEHHLEHLQKQGAHRVILALGHMADQVCDHLASGIAGLDLVMSIESKPLGTAGAVAHALDKLRSDSVVVVNGDSFIDVDMLAFVSWARTSIGGSALITTRVDQADRYGVLRITEDDVIESFDEKPVNCGQAWINAGIYWLDAVSLGMITSVAQGSLERDILPNLPVGHLRAYRSSSRFIDIGTPTSFASAAQWPCVAAESCGGSSP